METTFDTHIEQIVQSIFTTMLGMEVVRCDDGDTAVDETMLGTIQITGSTSMGVVLGVSDGVARASAAAMLMIPPEEVTSDDERDVVAELSNMIGGNLKSVLSGSLFLSLPTVVAGRDIGLQVAGAAIIEDVALACESGQLRVRLFSQTQEA